MTVYKEKYGTRRDTDNALRPSRSQLTWTDVPWDEGLEIPRAQLWAPHPDFPMLVCISRRRKGIGQPNERGQYEKCIVTAIYELVGLDKRPPDERPPTEEDTLLVDFGVEQWTPEGTFTYGSGGNDVKTTPSLTAPMVDFTINKTVNHLPVSQIIGALGKVNSGTIKVGGASAIAGTLLFKGLSSELPLYDSDGKKTYKVNYVLSYNPFGWNNLPLINGANIDWSAAYPPLYETANLSWLAT